MLPQGGTDILHGGQRGDGRQVECGGYRPVHVARRVIGDLELVGRRARLDRVGRQHAHPRVLDEHSVVRHRQHGVEVHERAGLRHVDGHQAAGRSGREQPLGEYLDRLRRGSLAHPDQHRPVADDQDVAALDGGWPGLGPVVPDVEVRRREHRMPAIDGFRGQRLRDPGRPAHLVDGDPTVDPARRVPLVEQVRQRHEDEVVRVEGMKGDALRLRAEFGDLALGDPASQESGQAGRVEAAHRGAQGAGGERPVPARIEHAVQDVFARLRDLQGLGQQITVVVDHYVMRAQRIGERVVLGLRPGHPEHVVEEQVGGVLGRKPLEF